MSGAAEGTVESAAGAPPPLLIPVEPKAAPRVIARPDDKIVNLRELDEMLMQVSDALVTIDQDGLIGYASPAVRQLIGYDPHTLIGQPARIFLDPEQADGALAALYLRGPQRDPGITVRLRHADGNYHEVQAFSRPSPSADVTFVPVVLRPVQDRGHTLDALRHRLAFEDLLTGIAATFLHRAAHEVDASIDLVLADIGQFAAADRAYVYVLHDDRDLIEASHEWVNAGIAPAHTDERFVGVDALPRWLMTLRDGEAVYLPSVADLGEDWQLERNFLETRNVASSLAVAISDEDRLIGFIGFDLVTGERLWSDDHLAVLSATAGIISQALARQEAEQRFGLAFDRAPLGMALHGPDGHHLQVNPAFCTLLGREADSILGTSVLDFILEEDRASLVDQHRRLVAGEVDQLAMELRFIRDDGAVVWCRVHSAAVCSGDGTLRYTVSHVEDVTELKRSEAELAHQALHDPLTGLANRALLLDHLERSLARLGDPGRGATAPPALLFIDLDRFKLVNDSLGHRAGDQLLMAVAERLAKVMRPSDLIARLGGDEFVVVLDGVDDSTEPVRVAERIRGALAVPLEVSGNEVVTTGSIGIAMPTVETNDAEGLLRDADAAMYLAKANGRDRFEIFDTALRTQATEKLQMESALRRALDSGGFEVHYQPELDLNTGTVVGFEALVRWNHPTEGRIAAWAFIELAEETGIILELGEWVLREACRQAGEWRRTRPEQPLTLRVNLSGRQFAQADLVEQVVGALEAGQLDASSLCLEITETALMSDPAMGLRVLNDLRALGIELAIDDFGTGYSSLAYLKRFPVDVLKIDRSFVDGLGEDPDDTAIATAIISLARSMGLRVVAEGVETRRQLDELRRLGCDHAQGFLFARPSAAAEVWDLESPFPLSL